MMKIDADDVLCAHGSTSGQLDAKEIFYLMSRGLSSAQAKSMLVYGFIQTIVEGFASASWQKDLEALVSQLLPLYLEA